MTYYPCQRRCSALPAASFMLHALEMGADASRLRRLNRIVVASGYLAGFRDATDGAPFDPEFVDVIDDTRSAFGLPRDAWLSLIGRDPDDEL